MTQNRSMAVMSNRKSAPDDLDFYPTPPWATRALCEYLEPRFLISLQTALDPACGEGHMVRPLAESFRNVLASDVHQYGYGIVRDFLATWPATRRLPHWIITNPPFGLAEEFAHMAIQRAKVGTALLVRTAFLENAGRWNRLFKPCRPDVILQFVERVPMVKGRLDRHASTATSYCWLIWFANAGAFRSTCFEWIPPCRDRLEAEADYAPLLPLITGAPLSPDLVAA